MTDPDETASLIGSLIDGYREHVAAERAPGQVRGQDVEDQADMLAAAAARLADLLTAFAQEPQRSMDAMAVFRRLSETAASMESAAAELEQLRADAARERDELRAVLESRAQVLEESRGELRERAERAERDLDAARAELDLVRREARTAATPGGGTTPARRPQRGAAGEQRNP